MGRVVEKATDGVVSTSAAVPVVELEPVVSPVVAEVEKVSEKPLAAVDRTTADTVETTSKALSDSTARITATVKDVAHVRAAIVDPVVEVVEVVVPIEPHGDPTDPAPLPGLPDVVDEVLDVIEPDGGAPGASRDLVAVAKPVAVAPVTTAVSSPTAVMAQTSSGKDSSRAVLSDLSGTKPAPEMTPGHGVRSSGERLPAGLPGGPLGVVAEGAIAPSSGGSSTSGGADGALMAPLFDLPELASVSVASVQLCHAPGPCADPGSRPG
ncbi:hypothetical protein [Knoellia flava]|uniref:hypothetical protein n=1 Tax=Knoellia flava TaxID=913969 RepID=UPI0012EB3C4F|nr:hypothetical protein [Knoellia flava]